MKILVKGHPGKRGQNPVPGGHGARLAALRQQRRKVLLAVQSDIRKSIFTINTAWETWQRQEDTLKMTRSIRESVEKAYRAGKEPLARLNQAQTDYVMAAGAAASARVQYLIAKINLNAATGRLGLRRFTPLKKEDKTADTVHKNSLQNKP